MPVTLFHLSDSHFGREENVPPPSARDRYLGAPRLPRVDELPVPEVDPELYEAPRFEDRIIIPTLDSMGVDTTLMDVADTLIVVPVDSVETDTVTGDTLRM